MFVSELLPCILFGIWDKISIQRCILQAHIHQTHSCVPPFSVQQREEELKILPYYTMMNLERQHLRAAVSSLPQYNPRHPSSSLQFAELVSCYRLSWMCYPCHLTCYYFIKKT
uniref:Uncharacterized protein n=1 Tax=Sphaerodactylus townsendi TaxID=933632 RepID=A0ACB8G4Y2_9SAUR